MSSSSTSTVYVKVTGNDNNSGLEIGQEKRTLNNAYNVLGEDTACSIKVVYFGPPLPADPIILNKIHGITIEGWKSDGSGSEQMDIDTRINSQANYLFTCQKSVEFKFLTFKFPLSNCKWNRLIFADSDSVSLKISNCRFDRTEGMPYGSITVEAKRNSYDARSLVNVNVGSVSMVNISCTDLTKIASFSSVPFSFSGASEVSLKKVEINKVNVENGAAVEITDDGPSKVTIEGLNVQEVNTESGYVAGLQVWFYSEESIVSMGRTSKCTFKSCVTQKGASGAIYFRLEKAVPNLQLPAENNLDIDSSNIVESVTRSLVIFSTDFEKFCEQEDSFEFANDYDESKSGWIMGMQDPEAELVDVYEKYLKGRNKKPKEDPEAENKDNKKTKAGTVIAIVVPIVVVVVAVVVVVVVIVVVRKRKLRNVKNGNNE
ncbi:uncharacterized protein MONOS_9498 [Monocercomonoides exilis]|uniref:uncharacterized protein n=1 Tax=Monocercomonoides exilis TaxID=2049356 RepID=UPI00355AAC06|nr:hypothetical protein MONOS_9498 [Monocercomonoides exilis]|eukprot:MONOS_9498.1-p1 / transcript=MONOS_9498.1 / gene=MONOS_9498 / organism=Monocercomonoides_exilis_PA203 / gene_product=unspecified product / transcript_product=unspecified product / location=Mono_scaffold00394:36728-38020(-) / protein_length=431 / sequence_SO=supercontig / SO=protein_coding / is_pseudo=false